MRKHPKATKMTEIDLGKRVLDYFHKIKTSEVMWCEDHDREFLEGEKCPGCEGECEHDYESYGSEMFRRILIMGGPKNTLRNSFDGPSSYRFDGSGCSFLFSIYCYNQSLLFHETTYCYGFLRG